VTTIALATCSFAAYAERMGTGVRITLGVPRWPPPPGGRAHWVYLRELAPDPQWFRASPEVFDQRYLAKIGRLAGDIDRKLAWISERHPGPIIACCFERHVGEDPGRCHRRLWASWHEARTGQHVPELDP
jgi:hypothetical protein